MMSRRRVVASITSVAIVSSACVASSGAPMSSWFTPEQSTASAPSGAPASPTALGGYARLEGPRVSVYAEVENAAGSRLVRANFHLDDDAYVLVGHIDADGVLRIEFPEAPEDNGFARGQASYQTAQFFAGFAGEYRARFATGLYRLNGASANDSYDGGLGYVFVIASWQPMHFEKFATDGRWDSFEVSDANYAKDPRPAIYELASLLAGTNPSTYTVRFAKVFDTRTLYGASGGYFSDAYGSQMCNGFGYGYSFGFASSPFGFSAFNPVQIYGYGQSFWWRGSEYIYSQANDCYYQRNTYFPFGYRPYGYGWGVAQTPPPPAGPGVGRFIGIGQIRQPPLTPQPAPMHIAPGGATDVGGTNATKMTLAPTPDNTSPQYRTRGLVSHQDPAGGEVLAPRSVGVDRRARDAGNSVQGLVIRGSGNDSRSKADAGNDASSRRAPSAHAWDAPETNTRFPVQSDETGGRHVVYSPSSDAPRAAPQQRVESPRSDAPRMAPAPSPRVESPRVETPRAASPPPPRVEAPRSEPAPRSAPPPAASSSSSSGKPPGKN
jgi:hypothetical protein